MDLQGQSISDPSTAAPEAAEAPRLPVRRAFSRQITLSLKTTLVLLVMLIAAVGLCGYVFLRVTRGIVEDAKREQVQEFAYALAAVIDVEAQGGLAPLRARINQMAAIPDVDFLLITDAELQEIASRRFDDTAWVAYQRFLHDHPGQILTQAGQVHMHQADKERSFTIAVPIFVDGPATGADPAKKHLLGYLHVGAGSGTIEARLRYLEGAVMLTCMAVVLLALPMAYVIARHLTVPIQKLAHGAHALAAGKLSHRVFLHRRDELGELADAFNTMAHTNQQQQEEIKAANASLEAKVHQRTGELEKVNRRLQSEMAEKEDFLRAVSHDLNAPLRNISGMASMLILKYQSTLQADVLQRLARIQKNVEVECELINELLELSRIKTRREKLEPVDLHQMIEGLREQFSNDLETKNITLQVSGHLPVMECEKGRLRQVFQNLLDNAIKYMRAEGTRDISITQSRGTSEVVFHLADTGMGITPEDLPYVFHVFRRAKNATMMKIPGKGVGLSSVKSIVETYGGRIWVDSEVGQGTTFHLALPLQCFPELRGSAPAQVVPPPYGDAEASDAPAPKEEVLV